MTRCWAKASILMHAPEEKVEYTISWKRLWMPEEMECCQSPVDATDAKVLSEMVFELISALLPPSASAPAVMS